MKSIYLKEGEIIPLSFDKMFKRVFGDENNTKPIKFLIKEILDIDVDDIRIYNSELLGENYFDKKNEVDFIARINDNNIVNIEINTNISKEVINRNILYVCRIVSRNLKTSEKYHNLSRHIQINFDCGNRETKDPFRIYQLINKNNVSDILTDVITIYKIDVPYYLEMCYNQDRKLTNRERIIGMIGCNNLATFNKLVGENEIMKDIEKKVKDYSNDDDLLVTYDREEYLKFLAEVDKKEAEAKGIAQGEINGKLQEKKDIAKAMLKDGKPIKDIMKYTGFSETEINNL